MPTFKKSFALWLTILLFLSVSAFSNLYEKPQSSIQPGKSNLQTENPQITSVAGDSFQPSAAEKKQKNNQPTKTPKPTGTPPVIPPPADPGDSNLMISLALVAVVIILIGFWLNRQRVF